MKKILIILSVALVMSSCGIYGSYTRPEVQTDGLYGTAPTTDTTSLGDVEWREMFTDANLQLLIEEALTNNTDIRTSTLRVEQAQATLKSARLAFLPSFNIAPQGSVNSVMGSGQTSWGYNAPLTASWEIDVFSRLRNSKRRAKALYEQSCEYKQAVRTQLISGIANTYYTLLMLDAQYALSAETAAKWRESVEAMEAMKQAGMTNEAAVSQTKANSYAIEASLYDLEYQIRQVENSLASLLASAPRTIERGKLDMQQVPSELMVGVPLQLLTNRPDVKAAELSLKQAFYATAEARSAMYPSLKLSGSIGWTNNIGTIVDPGKLLLSAAASLLQPIFNAGSNRARVKIAKSQQQEAQLNFQQTLLNAGQEVNNALTQCQTARAKVDLRSRQVSSLETAVESTQMLMRHGTTTYLDVITAQQSLLGAQMSQITDRFNEIQGVVNLYRSLGGGRETNKQ